MPRRTREPSQYRSQESTYQHDRAQKYDLIDPAQPWSGESMLKDVPIAEPQIDHNVPSRLRHAVTTFAIIVVLAPTRAASEPAPQDLKRLSIEQLMQIDVTLATRRPEPVATAPTAISVATGEDIRRSGVTRWPMPSDLPTASTSRASTTARGPSRRAVSRRSRPTRCSS